MYASGNPIYRMGKISGILLYLIVSGLRLPGRNQKLINFRAIRARQPCEQIFDIGGYMMYAPNHAE